MKKNIKILIGVLILSMPTTLKLSAMEKNQKNVEESTEPIKNYNLSNDEDYFKYAVLEDHLKYVFSTIIAEDLKKYLLNSVKFLKNKDYHYSNVFSEPEQEELENKMEEDFKEFNKNYILQNINYFKNTKINFYFYKYLIYRIYSCAFFSLKNKLAYMLGESINKNENYTVIIETILRYGEDLFDDIMFYVEKSIYNDKCHNIKQHLKIPEKCASFKEYLEDNPNISIENAKEIMDDEIHRAIDGVIEYCEINNILRKNVEKIFKKAGLYNLI